MWLSRTMGLTATRGRNPGSVRPTQIGLWGHGNRMVELQKIIKKLSAELEEAGMTPVADDPLMSGLDLDPGHVSIEAEDETPT
jgi:hypothetical protein